MLRTRWYGRRGFVQLVDTNPADVLLPPRCLPIYLLNGRAVGAPKAGLAAMTRRHYHARRLASARSKGTYSCRGRRNRDPSRAWRTLARRYAHRHHVRKQRPRSVGRSGGLARRARPAGTTAAYLPVSASAFCTDLVARYMSGQAGDRVALRIRNVRGQTSLLDITGVDDPEHPLLANYELLQDGDLRHLQPDDLENRGD